MPLVGILVEGEDGRAKIGDSAETFHACVLRMSNMHFMERQKFAVD